VQHTANPVRGIAADGAPPHWLDREVLWNAVETFERRPDAGLAREVEIALPAELSREQAGHLVRSYVLARKIHEGGARPAFVAGSRVKGVAP